MDFVLLVARFVLAAVFVVAGVAKLADRAGSRQALVDFGVPAALAAPMGILLPLAELAVAAALIPVATAWWGALGALVLLLVFIAGISYNLARGRTPDCHCFGQLASAPAGRSTLVRNSMLAAIAGFVMWQGQDTAGSSVVRWVGVLTVGQTLVLIGGLSILGLLVAEGWLLLNLLRQNGRLLVRFDDLEQRVAAGGPVPTSPPLQSVAGLPVGAPAPAFTLQGLDGEPLTLEALRAPGKPVGLIFSDPGCGPCTALVPEIGRWQHDYADTLTLAFISRGTPEANRAKSSEHGVTHVLLQHDREVAQAYQAPATPSLVMVQPEGTIGSPVVAGAEAIRALVARTVGQAVPLPGLVPVNGNGNGAAHASGGPVAPKLGEPAPEVTLPDLSGKTVALADFRGSHTLVLFWNPGCGFCSRMLDDLKTWEAKLPQGALKLLIISTGTVEANQEIGVLAPVVLDQGFTVGQAFGAGGTPSAVLVDVEGKVASDVAIGASAVLALARTGQDRVSQAIP
jgi:peroxiredoxin